MSPAARSLPARSGIMPPRRILWLLDAPRMGGAEGMAARFAREHPPETDLRIAFWQTAAGHLENEIARTGVPVYNLRARRRMDWAAAQRLRHYLEAWRPELIHLHLQTATLWGGWLARRHKIPTVVTLHVLPGTAAAFRPRMFLYLEKLTLRHTAGKIIVLGEAHRQAWLAAGLPGERLLCLPHGLPERSADRDAAMQLRRRLGLRAQAKLWLTVAVVRAAKGWREWLPAARQIALHDASAHFAWLGGGAEWPELAREVRRQMPAARTHLPGEVAAPEVWYDASDGFIFPTHEEAQPTVLLEAMRAGLPVLASDIAANREVLGDAGEYFCPASAAALCAQWLRWAGNRQRREVQSQLGKQRVTQTYCFSHWARNLQHLYDRLTAYSAAQPAAEPGPSDCSVPLPL